MLYQLEERRVELRGSEHYVADSASVIGSVILGDRVSIWFNAVLRGDNDPIVIGDDSNIQDGAVLHTDLGLPLTIGRGVTVGHMVSLHSCKIDDYSLIGINAVVMNGAKIGKHCLVGASSLIPEGRVIPDGSLVVGTPGRVIRQLSDEEIERLHWSAEHYVENLRRYTQHLKIQVP